MIDVTEKSQVGKAGSVLEQMANMDHEQVLFCNDEATGLKAIIAIHNTVLGPSLGGTRMWEYRDESEALTDVLRLSRGMTYKSSLAGLNLGGGKAVIIGNSRKHKSEALMRKFGRFVDSLGGKYITAEDVGISTRDMEFVSMETDHVAGLPEYRGGSGDPSPVTAYGVYMGIKASAKQQYGSDALNGKKILVQGVGHVGEALVGMLVKENAEVMISDIFQDKIKAVVDTYGVKVIDVEDVYDTDMDIYSPCALGATVNDETLDRLKCSVICGAANNQLADEAKHGEAVRARGIVYAPDYLVNAGGIINCFWELNGYHREAALKQTEGIYDTTLDIFKKSADDNIPAYLAANKLAEARIEAIGKVQLTY